MKNCKVVMQKGLKALRFFNEFRIALLFMNKYFLLWIWEGGKTAVILRREGDRFFTHHHTPY